MGAAVLGVLINRATIPQARVVFSDNCLFTSRDGEPVLILRIGNTRGNFLLNPEIRIGLLTVRPRGNALAAAELSLIGRTPDRQLAVCRAVLALATRPSRKLCAAQYQHSGNAAGRSHPRWHRTQRRRQRRAGAAAPYCNVRSS